MHKGLIKQVDRDINSKKKLNKQEKAESYGYY